MAGHDKVHWLRLSYVNYYHKDLETFKNFAKDFGFAEAQADDKIAFYRGYGKDPILYIASHSLNGSSNSFKGAGFLAKSREHFDRACKIPGAITQDASKRPGGGHLVTITDPNGFGMDIVWGQAEQKLPPVAVSSSFGDTPGTNGALDKQRKGRI
jgi:hypothetical protein